MIRSFDVPIAMVNMVLTKTMSLMALDKRGILSFPHENTVKLQWLEHLWDHGNLFERWAVRANEIKSWCQVRKQMAIVYGNVFDLQQIIVCFVYSLELPQ